MSRATARNAALTVLAAAASFFALLLEWPRLASDDWRYFNTLPLFNHTAWVRQSWPLLDPWACGGVPYLANPQTRSFSPNALFDLVAPPPLANVLAILAFGVIGLVAMYRLARALGASRPSAAVASFAFSSSGWFGLHFAVGHMTFSSMQLLPLVLFLALRPRSIRRLWGLMLTLGLMLLDGGVYAFIFSCMMLLVAWLTGLADVRGYFALLRTRPFSSLLALFAGLCLMAGKIVPVLATFAGRDHTSEFLYVFQDLPKALFWPFVDNKTESHLRWGNAFFETGCYLGIGLSVLVVYNIARRKHLPTWERLDRRLLVALALFFWIGSGWLKYVNPWALMKLVPLIQNAHVQTRYLLVAFLFFLLLAARALDRIERKKLYWALCVLSIVESAVAKNYPILSEAASSQPQVPELLTTAIIPSTTVAATVELLDKPQLYFAANTASRKCYEPVVNFEAVGPVQADHPAVTAPGTAALVEYLPDRMTITYDLPQPGELVVNTSYWPGWVIRADDASGSAASILPDRKLLTIRAAGTGRLSLAYRPWYLTFALAATVLGFALFFLAGLRATISAEARRLAK